MKQNINAQILSGFMTAILLTSSDLSKGELRFQCCIHPWMRVKVEVK